MHGRRRYRPVHQRTPWLVRAGCAGVLVGVVMAARCVPVQVTPASSDPCPVLRTLAATALYDRLPPTPEDEEATDRLNADLQAVRAQIEESCHR